VVMDAADRLWCYVAMRFEACAFVDARGRPCDHPAFRWLCEVLIERGWLVGPEGGWFREHRWRRPWDPPHPWCADWTKPHHDYMRRLLNG
jgi:hypothetical protein